jgi:bacitracin synthase 3
MVRSLIEELISNGFHLSFSEDQLFIDGDTETIKPEMIEIIRLHKMEIIRLLKIKEQEIADITPAKLQEYYPTTPAQKRMFLLQQFNLSTIAYNISNTFVLDQFMSVDKLELCINLLIRRHESLRTQFEIVEGSLVQKVNKEFEFFLEEVNIDVIDYQEILKDSIQPFDLLSFPLFRIKVFHTKNDRTILLIDVHHIISDHISQEILKKELFDIYFGFELEPLELQYKDYAVWLDKNQNINEINSAKNYWINEFKNPPLLLNLPFDYVRPSMPNYEGAIIDLILSKEEMLMLNHLAIDFDVTKSVLLLSILNILMFKITTQEDFCIGMPISGRNNINLNSIVGVFINTLAIRSNVDPSKCLKDYILEVKNSVVNALEHQSYPFENLIETIFNSEMLSGNPLFNVMFNYLNLTNEDDNSLISESNNKNHYLGTSKFDLTLTVTQKKSNIILSFNYSTSLFEADTIMTIIGYYKKILYSLKSSAYIPINQINILSEKELDNLLYHSNNTDFKLPSYAKNVVELFENQTVVNFDKIAVVFGNEQITYSELNAKSNQLGRYLLNNGGGTDTIVGLLFNINIDTIISMLAVMKIGATFLPLNESLPEKRLKEIIKKSKCNLILTNIDNYQNFKFKENVRIVNDEIFVNERTNIEANICPINSVYVIFTSGTTGVPKGVLVKDESLLNYVQWFSDFGEINALDKTVLVTHFSFDLGYTAIFSSLLSGGELHLLETAKYLRPDYLLNYIDQNEITYLKLTPSLYTSLLHCFGFDKLSESLKTVVLGGEKLSSNVIKESLSKNERIQLINHYGPTEVTIGCIAYKIDEKDVYDFTNNCIIGKPIYNTHLYICDKNLSLVPTGTEGELYVSGIGLAKGYINDVELTSKAFIENPFIPGRYMYKTGDIVKRRKDGNIQFLYRVDGQAKVNGYRVEFEDIKMGMLKLKEIKDVVIVTRKIEEQDLIFAYYVADKKLDDDVLRDFLYYELALYMIPNNFIFLEKIPVTLNGKIDFNKLMTEHNSIEDLVFPSTEQELIMVNIWSEVLNIAASSISVKISFFSLGGNSLKLIMLISKIQGEFGVELLVKDIFMNNTVQSLLNFIHKKSEWENYLLYQELKELNEDEIRKLLNED